MNKDMGRGWLFLGFLVLLFLSALFSGLEIAFASARRAKIRHVAKKNKRKIKKMERLFKRSESVIGTVLILNNIVNILISVLAGVVAVEAFGRIGIGIATFVVAFFILVFGEIIPKSFALRNERFLLAFADFLDAVTKLLSPLVNFLLSVSNFIIAKLGHEKSGLKITEEDIKTLVKIGEEEGSITRDERKLINEVFDFDETRVNEVKKSREEIVAIDRKKRIGDVRKIIMKTGFSRIPVYDGSIDNIVGMVHAKDLLKVKDENEGIESLLRPVLKVKDNELADELLRKMQKTGIHLAILQNKHGKTSGMITLEDLIEEVFGEIRDEHKEKE